MIRVAAAILLAALGGHAAADDDTWAALRRGGNIVVLRHALTPAQLGDPPGFRLEDCATQRNLTEDGIAQAERIGAAFRAQGVSIDEVRSSRWCRCLDTARIAFERVEPWPVLDALSFDSPAQRAEKAAVLQREVARVGGAGNRVLVTHNFNIQGAFGTSVAMGEGLVLAPDGREGYRVVGRIPAP